VINPWLITSLSVAVAVDIGAPLALALFLARRLGCRWRWWLVGLLVFLLFQGVTRIPAMLYLQTRPFVQDAFKDPAVQWPFLLAAAFTAGLFEEGGRWLAVRFVVPPPERNLRTALMLGAGHGGLESIGVGVLALLALVGYLAVTLMPPETFGAAADQVRAARDHFARMPAWEPLLGGWERLGALTAHLAFSVMVMQSFLRGRRWWWYALAGHTLLDFGSVAVLKLATARWGETFGILAAEAFVTAFALPCLWLIVALRPRAGQAAAAETPVTEEAPTATGITAPGPTGVAPEVARPPGDAGVKPDLP
jgi:uncharacterized membrane protein YhfC